MAFILKSFSFINFIRLGRILSRYDYEEITIGIIDAFTPNINRYGSGSSMLLQAIDFLEGPSYEVIVVGDRIKSQRLLNAISKNKNLNKVIIYNDSKNKIFNFLDYYISGNDGNPLVYVCQNYSCKLPTDNLIDINKMLNK